MCGFAAEGRQRAVPVGGVARNRSGSIELTDMARSLVETQKGTLMSAPQTNIEKQKRWHRGPLIGMAVVAIFGVGMIFFWLMHEASNGDSPTKSPEGGAVTAPAAAVPAPATTATVPAN